MSRKKKNSTSPATNPPTLKIGSRVRCTEDGVEGRIVWANAASVKIRWDDVEQVTWRRDALAGRPLAILAEGGDEDPSVSSVAADTNAATDPRETPPKESVAAPSVGQGLPSAEQPEAEAPAQPAARKPVPAEQPAEVPSVDSTAAAETAAFDPPPAEPTPAAVAVSVEAVPQTPTHREQALGQPESDVVAAKPPRTWERKQVADGQHKRLSALDAAALVLAETGQAMTCPEMIAAMAAKGYWSSPGGKTPAATLYSALLREITTKGSGSRFVKTQRGKFACTGVL
jgi:hypothetical protein